MRYEILKLRYKNQSLSEKERFYSKIPMIVYLMTILLGLGVYNFNVWEMDNLDEKIGLLIVFLGVIGYIYRGAYIEGFYEGFDSGWYGAENKDELYKNE